MYIVLGASCLVIIWLSKAERTQAKFCESGIRKLLASGSSRDLNSLTGGLVLQDKQQGMSQSLFYTVFHGRTIHQESWTGTVHHNTISHLHTQHIDRFAHKILN